MARPPKEQPPRNLSGILDRRKLALWRVVTNAGYPPKGQAGKPVKLSGFRTEGAPLPTRTWSPEHVTNPTKPAPDPAFEAALSDPPFAARHIGPDPSEQQAMLDTIGSENLDALLAETIPHSILTTAPLDLAGPLSETQALARLQEFAAQNTEVVSLIGTGYYGTVTPGVIKRNVLENPAWYTAYTPYQPEISQGRLEALLNFQTMVSDLTGVEIANASMLDEATAAAEAMTLLHRASKTKRSTFRVDHACHPQTIAVIETRAVPLGIAVEVTDRNAPLSDDVFGVLIQYPGTTGEVVDLEPLVAAAHDGGALVAVAADILALVLLPSPGSVGADVVVGSTQRFGVPLGYGGPHAGYLAARESFKRSLPGRLVGVSVDAHERPALRLALQTREQHIRREKATSNICTAQVLLANISGMYATYHGPGGLRRIAQRVHRLAATLGHGLRAEGIELEHDLFFDTVVARAPGTAASVVEAALAAGINLRLIDDDRVGISFDETSEVETLHKVLGAFGANPLDPEPAFDVLTHDQYRTDEILDHEVFHRYRSETEMLRYLRKLADKDIALDRAMIPLGSCTMKLNATTEMEPITWPEFANIHPFAPIDQAEGYQNLIGELEAMLVEITGYDAVSLQPNAGSQGEFAGLLAIRAYHHANGDEQRHICLIPASAHGTNAASAVMAGMKVVVVACDDEGNVDMGDLKNKVVESGDDLSAVMVTYPSTHGVFETSIRQICDLVHEYGGQVYLDGANLNAMVGTAKPGQFGADVSHLNLHKTFCIPHGGGGPGVGPIGVGAHLAPFLPDHPFFSEAGPDVGPEVGCGTISAAPWGSAGILPISWTYIALMGASGLRQATEAAILSANYIATRLEPHFPVLYRGENGRVAHECIVDLRPIKDETGVSVDDVAKRLIDYGFHAPTMSFPVAGTLMIEPTESESREEVDRFCDAMIAIGTEIAKVRNGEWSSDDNPLVNAPHTAEDLLVEDWTAGYSRETAAYPVPGLRHNKYWPPVSRIDNAHGDKNLVCSCPPMSEYE